MKRAAAILSAIILSIGLVQPVTAAEIPVIEVLNEEDVLFDGDEVSNSEIIYDPQENTVISEDAYVDDAEGYEIEESVSEDQVSETIPAEGDITETEEEESEEAIETGTEEDLEQAAAANVSYRTHVQSVGWQGWKENGAMSGTSGQAKRLEGIEIKVSGVKDLGIQYKTHIQSYGWESSWKENGKMSGTSGQAKRLEAIQIQLTGNAASNYDVWYCVHAQHFGWLDWAKNGAQAGTEGYAYRLEGIMIKVLPKGSKVPARMGTTTSAFYSKANGPAVNKSKTGIAYNTHVQTFGWQDYAYNGTMAGTSGQAKRLEGIHISLVNPKYSGNIEYCTHIQSIGWQGWKKNGQMSGTSGQAKRLEAIQIKLTGEMADHYDVYYRVHAQQFGWMGWAKNGAQAGTAGYSYRLEAIQIVLTEKGGTAPATNLGGQKQTSAPAFSQNRTKVFPSLKSLGINYSDTANSKVDNELRKMYAFWASQGMDFDSFSKYDKAIAVWYYVADNFYYAFNSHSAESMIDNRSGTCYAYSDLVYCFARKVGLTNTWRTVPGRCVEREKEEAGSLHQVALTLIDGEYYYLDAQVGWIAAVEKPYADYMLGRTNTRREGDGRHQLIPVFYKENGVSLDSPMYVSRVFIWYCEKYISWISEEELDTLRTKMKQ